MKRDAKSAAEAILRRWERADGKHPRSHENHEYLSLIKRLGPSVCKAYLALLKEEKDGQ